MSVCVSSMPSNVADQMILTFSLARWKKKQDIFSIPIQASSMALIRIEKKMIVSAQRVKFPFVVHSFQFFMRSELIEFIQRFRIAQLSTSSNPFTHTQAQDRPTC